jgi:hypothetical protein
MNRKIAGLTLGRSGEAPKRDSRGGCPTPAVVFMGNFSFGYDEQKFG